MDKIPDHPKSLTSPLCCTVYCPESPEQAVFLLAQRGACSGKDLFHQQNSVHRYGSPRGFCRRKELLTVGRGTSPSPLPTATPHALKCYSWGKGDSQEQLRERESSCGNSSAGFKPVFFNPTPSLHQISTEYFQQQFQFFSPGKQYPSFPHDFKVPRILKYQMYSSWKMKCGF